MFGDTTPVAGRLAVSLTGSESNPLSLPAVRRLFRGSPIRTGAPAFGTLFDSRHIFPRKIGNPERTLSPVGAVLRGVPTTPLRLWSGPDTSPDLRGLPGGSRFREGELRGRSRLECVFVLYP